MSNEHLFGDEQQRGAMSGSEAKHLRSVLHCYETLPEDFPPVERTGDGEDYSAPRLVYAYFFSERTWSVFGESGDRQREAEQRRKSCSAERPSRVRRRRS